MMRASISKSATAAGNSLGASTFRPSAQRPALAVRPAATSFRHDFSQMPIHAARQPRMLPDFPHAQKLESAFNRNIPGRAVIDEKGCEQRAVPAFTDRTTAHFASPNPPLRVAAHEAVHVLQHSGLSRDAHLGPERHADSVSRLIVKGASVRHLLSSEGAVVEPAIRLYTEIYGDELHGESAHDAGSKFRVSDDGRMAVDQDFQQRYWADPSLIAASNRTLASNKSVIQLEARGSEQLMCNAPEDRTRRTVRTLSRVLPKNKSTSTSGENMTTWADCGRCAGDVMGAGKGMGWGRTTAKYRVQTPIPGPRTTAEDMHPAAMGHEIFERKLRGGQAEYEKMSPEQQERFDKKTGINRYAAARPGEGYAIVRDRWAEPAQSGRQDWPFHWAAVVTASGHDQVTLENLGVSDVNAMNTYWTFQMYGSPSAKPDKQGQTFHEQQKQTGSFGDEEHNAPTTIAVRKRK